VFVLIRDEAEYLGIGARAKTSPGIQGGVPDFFFDI
jgi:hypothetical protein